ncbi:MAG: methylamine dehydrogenase (amicyanin) light chain [Gammaproteobacteria bacterium]|nr:methylamine dehydrogenase (amicyanin) light chain [Gammaproteobacteria bacterium]MYB36853.1 methylamine dehydrogenase (amicyanin) light chain [Gammaproteobacteria bacterium]
MKGPTGQQGGNGAGIAGWFDGAAHRATAGLARHTSRRGFLGRLGAILAGAATVPLLPVSRAFGAEDEGTQAPLPEPAADGIVEYGDPQSCEYWRYCALGGSLCSCCGGTMNSCPPGAEPSPITWVGTCRNPVDDKEYLISYNDCCGKAYCPRCSCHRTEGAKPSYFPSKSPNVLWCFGVESNAYHCTMAAVIGAAPAEAEATVEES